MKVTKHSRIARGRHFVSHFSWNTADKNDVHAIWFIHTNNYNDHAVLRTASSHNGHSFSHLSHSIADKNPRAFPSFLYCACALVLSMDLTTCDDYDANQDFIYLKCSEDFECWQLRVSVLLSELSIFTRRGSSYGMEFSHIAYGNRDYCSISICVHFQHYLFNSYSHCMGAWKVQVR